MRVQKERFRNKFKGPHRNETMANYTLILDKYIWSKTTFFKLQKKDFTIIKTNGETRKQMYQFFS